MRRMNGSPKPAFLLHCCCAPCSTHPFHVLEENFRVTGFFYNPNIHPREEYEARKSEMERLAKAWGFPLIADSYNADVWFEAVKGYEEEPEGGRRCEICFRFRLERTARRAKDAGMAFFGTTLSVSPHKKAGVINRIGRELEATYGVRFYEADFKKKDGFRISCRLSKEEGLQRQDYCGCVFSRRGGPRSGEGA